MTWLVNSTQEKIGANCIHYPTPKEFWDSVNEMYSDMGNTSQEYELNLRIGEIKQGRDSVTKYFNNLKRNRQDLDVYYTHEWKTPEDSKYHNQVSEEGRIFKLLDGQKDEVDDVQAWIIGIETLRLIGEFLSKVRREKTRNYTRKEQKK